MVDKPTNNKQPNRYTRNFHKYHKYSGESTICLRLWHCQPLSSLGQPGSPKCGAARFCNLSGSVRSLNSSQKLRPALATDRMPQMPTDWANLPIGPNAMKWGSIYWPKRALRSTLAEAWVVLRLVDLRTAHWQRGRAAWEVDGRGHVSSV